MINNSNVLNDDKNNKYHSSNTKKNIMLASFKLLSLVFIDRIIKEKWEIKITYKYYVNIIKNNLKDIFLEYLNLKTNKNNINNINSSKYSTLDKLLDIKFIEFLKLAGFPFLEEKTSSEPIKLPKELKNSIEEKKKELSKPVKNILKEFKDNKKSKIYLNQLNFDKNKKIIEKNDSKEFYKIIFDRFDGFIFNKYLEQKCYNIINIFFLEDYSQIYEIIGEKKYKIKKSIFRTISKKIFRIIKTKKNKSNKIQNNNTETSTYNSTNMNNFIFNKDWIKHVNNYVFEDNNADLENKSNYQNNNSNYNDNNQKTEIFFYLKKKTKFSDC